MSDNFWHQLDRPIIGLSPMDGVTDHPFRHIQKKYGQPAVVYTEFTSVEGVCHGAKRLLTDFLYDETQRPIVAQIYGTTPDFFRQTATLLCQLGFDGIDINMGCPAKNVAHSGAGAALITTPKLAQEIVIATKAGVTDWQNGKTAADCTDIIPAIAREVEQRHQLLPAQYQSKRSVPVSVKTRVGFDKVVVHDWISTLLEVEPVTIALHGRTLKQQYGGSANWEEIGKAAELCHTTDTILLGNGDVKDLVDVKKKVVDYQVDGVLIGRATFGNPFVFLETPLTSPSIYEIAIEHAHLYEKTYQDSDKYHFLPMRKHLGWYIKDIPHAKEIRLALYRTETAAQAEAVLKQFELL